MSIIYKGIWEKAEYKNSKKYDYLFGENDKLFLKKCWNVNNNKSLILTNYLKKIDFT